ncbi:MULTISPECIES: hypothetical protein [unclassified Flavobacterium]|uniref:hypothetical protein n=1 Tax=unclassified Flavobacterium TaxID=196869 RepID=UPI003F93E880
MWKKLSIKSQLILILLIPFVGLIYITISNINFSLQHYKSINKSLENIENIATLSAGIELIGTERGLSNYSSFDSSVKKNYLKSKQNTNDWFLKNTIKDTLISNDLKKLHATILDLHESIDEKVESPITSFVKYTVINEHLINLIDREVVYSKYPKITTLANNYTNYVLLKRAALLKRGVVLQSLMDKKNNDTLIDLFFQSKVYMRSVDFKLSNFKLDSINRNLFKFQKSNYYSSFNSDAQDIINYKLKLSPSQWWEHSTLIVKNIAILEKTI